MKKRCSAWVFLFIIVSSTVTSAVITTKIRASDAVTFIVNRNNSATSVSTQELANYYLKKKTEWPDGTPVRFIDRNAGTLERKIFLSSILKKTSSDIDLFWIGQKLYTGDSTPLQVTSDTMMLQMVGSFKGAIGYISPSTALKEESVKPIKVVKSE